jgi:hypothetical protein
MADTLSLLGVANYLDVLPIADGWLAALDLSVPGAGGGLHLLRRAVAGWEKQLLQPHDAWLIRSKFVIGRFERSLFWMRRLGETGDSAEIWRVAVPESDSIPEALLVARVSPHGFTSPVFLPTGKGFLVLVRVGVPPNEVRAFWTAETLTPLGTITLPADNSFGLLARETSHGFVLVHGGFRGTYPDLVPYLATSQVSVRCGNSVP